MQSGWTCSRGRIGLALAPAPLPAGAAKLLVHAAVLIRVDAAGQHVGHDEAADVHGDAGATDRAEHLKPREHDDFLSMPV